MESWVGGDGRKGRRHYLAVTKPPPPNVRFGLPGFAPGVRDAIYAHVYSDPANEVGGLLAGDLRPDGVMVVGAVRAEGASGDVTSLTFTHESWSAMLAELEAQYPGAEIVGWYHSHPGHGVFLSRHDEFIHSNFFPAAWQFAIVVDPHHHNEGLFMWRDGQLPPVAKAPVDPRWTGAPSRGPAFTPRPDDRAPVEPQPVGASAAPPVEPPPDEPPPVRIPPRRPSEVPPEPRRAPSRSRSHEPRTAADRDRDRDERARRRAEVAAGRGHTPSSRERAAATARAASIVAIGFGLGAVVWLLDRL